MKLTRERLKEIIKEELEEIMSKRDREIHYGETPIPGAGVAKLPTPDQQKPQSSEVADRIEALVVNKKLPEDDPNVKLLRALRNFVREYEINGSSKELYKRLLQGQGGLQKAISLIDEPRLKLDIQAALGMQIKPPV